MARRVGWLPLVCLAVLVALTVQVVQHDGIVMVDLHLRSWVANHQIGPVRSALTVVTDIVSPPVEIVAVMVYFWRRRRDRFRTAAVTVIATQAIVIVMKAVIARPTPVHVSFFYGDYPSGHTAMLLTCAGTVIILGEFSTTTTRRLWAATGVATAAIMACLIYVQGHWLSDTLASVALASVVLWLLAATATDR